MFTYHEHKYAYALHSTLKVTAYFLRYATVVHVLYIHLSYISTELPYEDREIAYYFNIMFTYHEHKYAYALHSTLKVTAYFLRYATVVHVLYIHTVTLSQ